MKIFAHQSAAYEELLIRARTYFRGNWRGLSIGTRWHSLVIGPTGTGKSALGTMLAAELGAEFCGPLGAEVALLRINATGWMPSGAHNRAVAETLSIIIDHIHSYPKTILFIDELDKLWHENSWNSYIRGELFEILDGRLPTGAKGIPDGSLETDDEGTLTLSQASSVAEKLRFNTFVIGAGTFQDFYETAAGGAPIGFHPEPQTPPPICGPTPEIITKRLPRELVNRFNSSILLISSLDPSDYRLIARQAENSLPGWIQAAFREAVSQRIQQAIAARSGCRFIEEALADALKNTPEKPEPDSCEL